MMVLQFALIQPILDLFSDTVSKTLIKIAFGLLIFFIGFVAGKIIGRLVYKILKEIEINEFIKRSTHLKINADSLISSILSYAIYFLSLVAALDQIGITNIVLYLLAGAVILIILLSFFLAVRDFLPNVLSGMYLYSKENLREGNYIEVGNIKGEVVHIDLFQIKIINSRGDILFLPNSMVAKSPVKILKKKPKK